MKKRIILTLALIAGIAVFGPAGGVPAIAGETDVLINKLVEKGILTPEEARALLMEMQGEAVRTKSTVQHVASETAKEVAQKEAKAATASLPKWVEKMTIKGDFRLRYQRENTEDDGKTGRSRLRIRWRLGADTEIADKWKVGFGLASGGDDPRSTNQTLTNTFETPDARLDYAYAQYEPWKFLKMVGGKFKNPLWKPKDLVWDDDIRTDGIAIPFFYKVDNVKLFATGAWFVLDEFSATRDDPYMWVFQGGADASFGPGLYAKGAASYYDYHYLDGNSFKHSAGSNTKVGGVLVEDYDAWEVDGEFGIRMKNGPVPMVAAFGQYINSKAKEDTGYLFGIKLGHPRCNEFLRWQLAYNYRYLQQDAVPDFLPDSDFYGGKTNAKGHEFQARIGLAKNTSFAIDYYWDVRPISGNLTDQRQYVLQADLLLLW